MLEHLAGLLGRFLPAAVARDLFTPACHDLRIEQLHRPRRLVTVGRLLALYADCWRLYFTDPDRLIPRRRPTPGPGQPRESFPMLRYQLRHALRRLRREPGFTAAAVLTLALGVGANLAVFAVVEAVLLRPLPYPEADRLVILNHRDQRTGVTKEFIAIGDYLDLATRQKTFEGVGAYGNFQATIFEQGEPFQVPALTGTAELLRALRFQPFLGRGLVPEDALEGAGPVMLLGYDLWRSKFDGDSAIVGRSIKVGATLRQVVGIAPPSFRFPPSAGTAVILSMTLPAQAPAERKAGWTFAVGRLAAGRSTSDATAELGAISRQLEREYPAANAGSSYYAVPLRDQLVGSTKGALMLMFAAVAFVLTIACANVANLLLARSLTRRREMAVRLALGAGRGRLAGQLLAESGVLALVAGVVAIGIAYGGARALVTLVPPSLLAPGLGEIRINGAVLGFALLITLGSALGFGLLAMATTRFESAASTLVTAGRATMSGFSRRAASGLVVVEMAFAVILLIGAGLAVRSFVTLLAVDPGFSYQRVVTLPLTLPAERYQELAAREAFWGRALPALRAVPGVATVGSAAVVPLTGNNWTVGLERIDQPVPPGQRAPDVGWQFASAGYFQALRIKLVEGRLFEDRDRSPAPPVVIVSEAVARRHFPDGSPVGRFLRTAAGPAEIVGVVGDIRRAGLDDQPRADLYFPFERTLTTQTTLFLRTEGDPLAPVAAVRAALPEIEPNTVLGEPRTMEAIAADSVRVGRLLLWLLSVFAVTAILLAAVGIYGVMSCVVRQRLREIGTRIALGASRPAILRLVLRQGGALAGAGVALGLAVGLGAARLLESLLYGVKATDPLVLGLAGLVLIGTSLAACYLPARRAAAVDPVKTLAQE